MRTWDKRSLEVLSEIHGDLRRVLEHAKQISPVDFEAIEGLRATSRQVEMVRTGKSKTMNSRHLTGHAVDCMPRDPKTGKLVNGDTPYEISLFVKMGEAIKRAAQELGVDIGWGKDLWDWDYYHFQLRWRSYPIGGPETAPRPENSKTVKAASSAAVITAVSSAAPVISSLAGINMNWPFVTLALGVVIIGLIGYIVRERTKKFEEYGV